MKHVINLAGQSFHNAQQFHPIVFLIIGGPTLYGNLSAHSKSRLTLITELAPPAGITNAVEATATRPVPTVSPFARAQVTSL